MTVKVYLPTVPINDWMNEWAIMPFMEVAVEATLQLMSCVLQKSPKHRGHARQASLPGYVHLVYHIISYMDWLIFKCTGVQPQHSSHFLQPKQQQGQCV